MKTYFALVTVTYATLSAVANLNGATKSFAKEFNTRREAETYARECGRDENYTRVIVFATEAKGSRDTHDYSPVFQTSNFCGKKKATYKRLAALSSVYLEVFFNNNKHHGGKLIF